MRFDSLAVFNKTSARNGTITYYSQHPARVHDGEALSGHAYHEGKKFLSRVDQYAGIAKGVIGTVAPIVGSLSGPVGQAVGAAVGGGMQALTQYDRLKSEAMNQHNQIANVGAAVKRGMG